ncbi:MAG: AbrB/MazE/SpoVT family DNA-binding domain-containing protein [Pseudonocardia sp.]
MARTVLRPRGQLTLPQEVRDALRIAEGDDVEFVLTDDGVLMRGLKSIPAEQAWFWTQEWQAGEQEASRQADTGEGTVFADGDSFLDSLR